MKLMPGVQRVTCRLLVAALLLASAWGAWQPQRAWAELPPFDETIADDDFSAGLIPDNTPAPTIHDANEPVMLMSSGEIPESYDARDFGLVTPVKDQNPFATCWAFATIGSLESSLLAHGEASAGLDLSERHLAYFVYNAAPDPLGNTAGDVTGPTGANYLMRGANYALAAHTLESWMGAVDETAVPTYDDLKQNYVSSDLSAVALDASTSHALDSYHLTGVRRIPMSDTDQIKRAIMENGAVGLSIRYSSSCFNRFSGGHYNASLTAGEAHTVTAVGWDDTYALDNFAGTTAGDVPTAPGAWICKNSYGVTGSQAPMGGYFYVSYEEAYLNRKNSAGAALEKAYVFEGAAADALDNIYQYDGTAGTCMNSVSSGGSIANVFEAKANPSGEERLRAISFATSDVNVCYHIQVYTNLADARNPTSGEAAFDVPLSGVTSYAGYYTIEVPEAASVRLMEGSSFAVVIKLEHADGTDVAYDVDCTYGNGSTSGRYASSTTWYYCNAHVEPGQSFECDAAGDAWDDLSLATYDPSDEPACSARIKAFTTNESLDPAFDIAKAQVDAPDRQRFTGEGLEPSVVVRDGDTTLVEGRHFHVTYRDNVEVGHAHVTIEGVGAYYGTTSCTFEIYADPRWDRLWGDSALDTMVAIVSADDVFTAANVDTVVVASADGYKDALAATGLAGRKHAPVLITPKSRLAEQTKDQLSRLKPRTVIVAGGPLAVSDAVLGQIRAALPESDVYRVYGQNAVETSVALWRAGDTWGTTAVIATSNSYKDALSIAPYAYAKGAPIFLANPSKIESKRVLSSEVLSALARGGFTRVVIVGGTSAVAASVDASVQSHLATGGAGACEVVRLSGVDALETSRLIGQFELAEGMGLTHMTVATTTSYKDALCGASLAGAQNSVLVLASRQGGYTAFDALAKRTMIAHGHVLGGPLAISEESYGHFSSV